MSSTTSHSPGTTPVVGSPVDAPSSAPPLEPVLAPPVLAPPVLAPPVLESAAPVLASTPPVLEPAPVDSPVPVPALADVMPPLALASASPDDPSSVPPDMLAEALPLASFEPLSSPHATPSATAAIARRILPTPASAFMSPC
jgi:hypothetical protein